MAGVRPPPLAETGAGVKLAVAAVPGEIPEEWTYAAPGAWFAWPEAAAVAQWHAEVMTAGQLRALLAAREQGTA